MSGTRCINGRELRQLYEHKGGKVVYDHLTEALEKKQLRPEDFSIAELCEAFMGRDYINALRPKSGYYVHSDVMESDAVSFRDFSQITGQILFTSVKESLMQEEFVFQKVVPVIPSKEQGVEKVPGISEIGDDLEVVGEEQPYPSLGVAQDFIEVAAKVKRGGIVNVTREAILGDKTSVLLDRCKKLGFWLGLNREKRIIDAIVDENAGATSIHSGGHRYHWRGTSIATYGNNSGTHTWDNLEASNALVDWSDINNAWLLLRAMLDPFTGEPIMISPKHLIVTPQLEWQAKMILTATRVVRHAGGYATSGNLNEFEAGNPVPSGISILSSQLLASRMATDTDWFMGDISKALAVYENWGVETEEAPKDSYEAYTRDIAFSIKASCKDAVATLEPRLMVESTA